MAYAMHVYISSTEMFLNQTVFLFGFIYKYFYIFKYPIQTWQPTRNRRRTNWKMILFFNQKLFQILIASTIFVNRKYYLVVGSRCSFLFVIISRTWKKARLCTLGGSVNRHFHFTDISEQKHFPHSDFNDTFVALAEKKNGSNRHINSLIARKLINCGSTGFKTSTTVMSNLIINLLSQK